MFGGVLEKHLVMCYNKTKRERGERMLDIKNLGKYRENNRIEAKKALGGLPDAIWETYSAFANTLGGVILLGVEEYPDKSLHPIDLPEPVLMVEEFWRKLNDKKKVSMNILTEKDVEIQNIGGKNIIVITVPRAQRKDKPIYIDGDPVTGSYRRNGEGDYHCTREEVSAMQRDAYLRTPDMRVLSGTDMSVLDFDSIHSYRERMKQCRSGMVWQELEDEDLLYKLGAVGTDGDGRRCPTLAGLLMFGNSYTIAEQLPNYYLEYCEMSDDDERAVFRLNSKQDSWSGNLYSFYFAVHDRIVRDIRDEHICKALREALTNCIINADYYGRQGVIIVRRRSEIIFSNPGNFRIDIETAKSGGVSDPRNTALINMFSLIDVGKRSGGGISGIYRIWSRQGWEPPMISEDFQPARTTFSLSLSSSGALPEDDGRNDERQVTALQKDTLIEYLTDKVSADISELSQLLGVRISKVRELMAQLEEEGIAYAVKDGEKIRYRLRS